MSHSLLTALLLCVAVLSSNAHVGVGSPHAHLLPAGVAVHIETTKLLSQISPRYNCYNIDASPNRGFLWRNLSSPNLLQLAKGLPAGYLRFGGSGNDALWYGDGIGAQSCTDGAARKFQCMNGFAAATLAGIGRSLLKGNNSPKVCCSANAVA